MTKYLRAAGSAALFLALWAALNTLCNLRYPGPEPAAWFLLPSLDVTALLLLFAGLGIFRLRVPRGATMALAVFLIFVRVLRTSEALVQLNYYRPLNLYLDVPLVADLARLMRSTVSLPTLLGASVVALMVLALLTFATTWALGYTQRYLASGWPARGVLGGVVLLTAALSPLWRPADPRLSVGLFGASIVPGLADQLRYAVSASAVRRAKTVELAAVQERLQRTPSDLQKLHGADVLLFLVESYGAAVYHRPEFREGIANAHRSFAARVEQAGYTVATSLVGAPIYGGGSWFSHATLATGLRVGDGLDFGLLRATRPHPRTMAWFFRQAGYRTVLVQPGTTRPWPEGEVHGFDRRYYAFDLEYRGPRFGWATMPDQYVIDFIHRRELARAPQPLFVQYALVSSHAPWSEQAAVVDDWSRLEGGAIYRQLPARRFDVPWEKLQQGGPAYIAALSYDFDVLARYLAQMVDRDTLVVVMGDHQPAASITGQDPSWAVPVHIASRERGLVELFTSDGDRWTAGMTPSSSSQKSPLPMEDLLTLLLERLSEGAR
jgi:hypothetical protein